VDATWKNAKSEHDQNKETESLRLDLLALNRVSKTQDVSLVYIFKTLPTNYIVWQLGLIANFGPGLDPEI